MLRFAFSPSSDMHLGDLRIALFNYIASKEKKEDFIVRIEDIDKNSNIDGKDQEILDLLALFKIEYSQVIYQSETIRFHTAMALQLIHDKKAFSCFCSDAWLENKKEEAIANKKPYRYDDACANLPAELVIDNNNPFSIRINKPQDSSIDSFIIMNQDKIPTYNFATAVDDMLNDISLVMQSENSINNQAQQEHIRDALGYEKQIEYIQIPTVKDEDTYSIKWLLEEGFLPEAILNYLISNKNIDKLRDINQEYLKALDPKELSRYVGFADEEIGLLAKVYLKDVSTTKELKAKIKPIFSQKTIPEEFKEQTDIMVEIIKVAPYFDQYDEFKDYLIKNSALKDENFLEPLSYLLTGSKETVDLAEIYKYIKNYLGEIIK